MTDPSEPEKRHHSSLSQHERDKIKKRLDELGHKMDAAKFNAVKGVKKSGNSLEAEADGNNAGNGMAIAMRMGSEFVVSVLIGGAAGWQLDKWLGTTPFLLFIFILLGFAAGTMGIIRTSKQLDKSRQQATSLNNTDLKRDTDIKREND